MSTLRDRLMEKVAAAEQVKVAEEVFVNAFIDELEKLGVDTEMLKESGLVGNFFGKAKSLVRGAIGANKVPKSLSGPGPYSAINKLKMNVSRAKASPAPVLKQRALEPVQAPWNKVRADRPFRSA